MRGWSRVVAHRWPHLLAPSRGTRNTPAGSVDGWRSPSSAVRPAGQISAPSSTRRELRACSARHRTGRPARSRPAICWPTANGGAGTRSLPRKCRVRRNHKCPLCGSSPHRVRWPPGRRPVEGPSGRAPAGPASLSRVRAAEDAARPQCHPMTTSGKPGALGRSTSEIRRRRSTTRVRGRRPTPCSGSRWADARSRCRSAAGAAASGPWA